MNAILESGFSPPPRILRLPPVRVRTGLARSTIYLRIAQGRFPRPISLGERAGGGIEVEMDAGLRLQTEAIWLVRQLVNGSGISRGDEPGELAVEVTSEPGEQIGLMAEDGGTVEAITAAGSEGHEPEWRRAMAKKFFWQRGADREKTVSGERIDEVHDEEGDRAEAEHLTRQPNSQRERDWAWCLQALRRGLDPAIVRARLEERRAEDQPNPEDYARRTVEGAAASLRREIPAQEIER